MKANAANLPICLLIFLSLLLDSAETIGQPHDRWADVINKGAGTLTVYYFPVNRLIYKEGDHVKGLCVEIVADFVEFINTKYKKKVAVNYAEAQPDFQTLLKKIEMTPNVLGVSNITITDQRKQFLKFTPHFMKMSSVLITNMAAPEVNDVSHLSLLGGCSAITISETIHNSQLLDVKKKYLPALPIKTTTLREAMFADINKDPKLFTVADFVDFLNASQKNQQLKLQKCNLGYSDELGFIMNLKTDWSAVWNEFLTEEYRESTNYKKHVSDNLGVPYLKLMQQTR